MTDQKPPEVSEEEWAQTPPSVRALLTRVIEQTQQTNDESAAAGSLDVGEGETVRMTHPESDEEGATINMPLSGSPAVEQASTISMANLEADDEDVEL